MMMLRDDERDKAQHGDGDDRQREGTTFEETTATTRRSFPFEIDENSCPPSDGQRSRRSENHRRPRLLWPTVMLVSSFIVATAIAAVVFPRSTSSTAAHSSPQPQHVPLLTTAKPAAPLPTIAPTQQQQPAKSVTRLDAFRSLLLNYSISSHRDLFNETSPQYQALTWLADEDSADLNVSTTASSNEVIVYRYILAAVYYANGGTSWIEDTNFRSAGSICTWRDFTNETGVLSCDPLRVKLDENHLLGTILSELGHLSSLQYLSLSFNELTGTIPTELAMLTNLTYLALYYNNLEGSLFTELGQLSNLQYLNLTSDQLSGTIPTELSKLAFLDTLGLSMNDLKGTIPSDLGSLSQLQVLDLSSNSFSGTVPATLASLSDLTWLAVNNNNITGNLTPVFCNRQWVELGVDCIVDCSCCMSCYA